MSLLRLVVCFALLQTGSAPVDAAQERAAMRMLPPQPLEPGNPGTRTTKYFDPRTYTSKDFLKLINGMGLQIGGDLSDKSTRIEFAQQFELLQAKMKLLEERLDGAVSVELCYKHLLALAAAVFLLALAAVLLAHVWLALKKFSACVGDGPAKSVRPDAVQPLIH